MKEGFRQCMAWLHTWTGLLPGWILFFVFVTGTAGYFQHEITHWMQPEHEQPQRVTQDAATVERLLDFAVNRLEQVAPVAETWQIVLPHENNRDRIGFSIRWRTMPAPGQTNGVSGSEILDPFTGAVVPPPPPPRETSGGRGLFRMHYELHYMSADTAIRIVGVCTMLMLIAIVAGVVTHKKIFTDFFTFRSGKGQRSWLDAHSVVSVMALPFFFMITYSGLIYFLFQYMPAGRDILYGPGPRGEQAYFDSLANRDPNHVEVHAPVSRPAVPLATLAARATEALGPDRLAGISLERHEGEPLEVNISGVRDTSMLDYYLGPRLRFNAETGEQLHIEPMIAPRRVESAIYTLHEGLFADIWGRWAYFIAGLLGCVMIATGLVLWTVKRRKYHLGSGFENAEHAGIRIVDTLNVASIAGLPIGMAAYFWANRLLPVGMADRAAWEFHSLFAVWLATLFYAMARPMHRAWIELLWAACLSYALVPILNALTSDKHLGHTLPEGDWILAGFDLTMLALGAAFAFIAVKVQRRVARIAQPAPAAMALAPERSMQ